MFCELFAQDLDAQTLEKIREAMEAESPLGAELRKRGTPRKDEAGQDPVPAVSGKLF